MPVAASSRSPAGDRWCRYVAARGRHVLRALGLSRRELSLAIVGDDEMRSLNRAYRRRNRPTDVLAFPMDELDTARPDDPDPGPALLGDVVLCPAVAVRQARAAGHTMDDELVLLATHGVLHLLGYDHMEPDEEKEMFGLQSRLIEGWRSAPREPVTGAPAGGEQSPR